MFLYKAKSVLLASCASRNATAVQTIHSANVTTRNAGSDESVQSCIKKMVAAAAPYDSGNASALIAFIRGN